MKVEIWARGAGGGLGGQDPSLIVDVSGCHRVREFSKCGKCWLEPHRWAAVVCVDLPAPLEGLGGEQDVPTRLPGASLGTRVYKPGFWTCFHGGNIVSVE